MEKKQEKNTKVDLLLERVFDFSGVERLSYKELQEYSFRVFQLSLGLLLNEYIPHERAELILKEIKKSELTFGGQAARELAKQLNERGDNNG